MALLSVFSRQPPGRLWLSPGELWEQDGTAEFVQVELLTSWILDCYRTLLQASSLHLPF